MQTEELVLKYFYAWQAQDWAAFRSCLAKGFKIDAGQIKFPNAESFIEFCKNGPSWSQIKLLESFFLENRAALLYEGVTQTGERVRISEFLAVKDDQITDSKITICLAE